MRSDLSIDDLERRIGVIAKQPAKCEQHGDFISVTTSRSEQPSGCPVCAETVQAERDRVAAQELAAKMARDRVERRLGAALIPPRFAGKTFASYCAESAKQKAALALCVDYAERFAEHYDAGRCLLLLGHVGTGKTHLAAAIAQHLITELNATAVYRTVYSLMQYVKGSFDRDAAYTEAQAYERLIQPHLLVLDEVGATKTTEFEQAALFNVINGRYEQQVPTIVISNLMPAEIASALGERCVDRLREGGGLCQVFDWKSARKEVS